MIYIIIIICISILSEYPGSDWAHLDRLVGTRVEVFVGGDESADPVVLRGHLLHQLTRVNVPHLGRGGGRGEGGREGGEGGRERERGRRGKGEGRGGREGGEEGRGEGGRERGGRKGGKGGREKRWREGRKGKGRERVRWERREGTS